MMSLITLKKYIVFRLDSELYRPFYKTRGPITFDIIDKDNVQHASHSFPEGRISVFKKKLKHGCRGLFARHDGKVVGYMWRMDYKSRKTVKADGYLPLKGYFSHLHFARVAPSMRGRALQLILFSKLIDDAIEKGITDIYTDMEQSNTIAMRGAVKLGFRPYFKLFTFRLKTGHLLSIRLKLGPKDIISPFPRKP